MNAVVVILILALIIGGILISKRKKDSGSATRPSTPPSPDKGQDPQDQNQTVGE